MRRGAVNRDNKIDRTIGQIHRIANSYAGEVEALEEHNIAFRRELNVTAREHLTYDEVRAARAEAQESFRKVILQILGDYMDDADRVRELLASVEDQQERIARYRRRRGSRPEVDGRCRSAKGHRRRLIHRRDKPAGVWRLKLGDSS